MHRSRLLMLIGAVVAALSLPLPLIELPVTGSVDGFEGDSWPGVLILAILAGAALFGDRAEGFGWGGALAAMATAGLAVVFAVIKFADAVQAIDSIEGGSLGAGIWVLLAGSLISLLGAALGTSRRLG